MCREWRIARASHCGGLQARRTCKSLFNVWAKVISELYDGGRERHKKPIVGLLYVANFELNGIRKPLKDDSIGFHFVRDTGNEIFQKNQFQKLLLSIERKYITTVSHVYKRTVVQVERNQTDMFASAAHLQLRAY